MLLRTIRRTPYSSLPFSKFFTSSKPRRTPYSSLPFSKFFTSSKPHVYSVHSYNSLNLLRDYFKSGRIKEAENLFDEMPEKNVSSWSVVIYGYSVNGFYMESMKSFSKMMFSGLLPNSFTMVGVLVSTVGLKNVKFAKSIHGTIVKCGLESHLIVSTAMLDTYAKCGNIFDSFKLFDGMKNPSLVSCSAIVSGFIYNEFPERGVLLFNRFRRSGLLPNSVMILSIIKGVVALGSRKLSESIHVLIVKLGLNSDISVNNSMLDMYSCFMDLDAARKIFRGMAHKDLISWTAMMVLLVNLRYARDALKIFFEMKKSRIIHDMVVIMSLISACVILGDLKKGRQAHAHAIVCGFDFELPLVNTMIAMYSKCGNLDYSRTLFNQTTEKSLVSFTAMMMGYVQNGCPTDALNLFIKLRQKNSYLIDSVVLVISVTASSELASLELCQQLHSYAFKFGFPQYRTVQNSLISAYSKCGHVDTAHLVFKEMGFLRDIVSWNAIMDGYGINGHGKKALALYHEMMKHGNDPDSATYLCILSACSHTGLLDDGLLIFNQMVEENRVKLEEEHFGCVVDLLARGGRLTDAGMIVEKLLEVTGPNVWKTLLNGCVLHGKVDLAELVARKVFEREPGEYGQVLLLANFYASVGRFEKAEALRSSLQKKGLVKNPGTSFLSSKS